MQSAEPSPQRGRHGRLRVLCHSLAVAGLALLAACGSIEKDPTAKWDADRLYAEARDEMSAGNWAASRKLMESLESRFPFGRYAQQAQIDIAYSYYKEGESAQAISAADRFLKLNPNHPAADYAYYLKGLAIFTDDLGYFGNLIGADPSLRDPKAMREAFDNYKELVSRFPQSKYAEDARHRMNYLVNAMAASEVNIARFYLIRRAYVAAIDRAQGAVRDYQGTPATEEGLSIMVRAYRALGIESLAADAERVLRANYPNSRYLQTTTASR
jgi:outer membrane protein assembly factor BamD